MRNSRGACLKGQ